MRSDRGDLLKLKFLVTLIAGIVIGFCFSQLFQSSQLTPNPASTSQSSPRDTTLLNAAHYLPSQISYFEKSGYFDKATTNSSLADYLFNSTRVLCWILTSPSTHTTRALHLKKTWGSRCNHLVFMSSETDEELGAVNLGVKEGRGNLWNKTREAAKYIYNNYLDKADWFLKADDDTYVIVENLRAFLYSYSTEDPVYFGCKFKPHVKQGYMSGGAGYVLSKEALRRFVTHGYNNSRICSQHKGGAEDIEMGKCLQNVGVMAGDSRDKQNRGTFFPSAANAHLIPKNKSHWYWRYIYYATQDGLNCCSDYAISFHYIHPTQFYVLDYYIYRLGVFGVQRLMNLPEKQNSTELFAKWRTESSDNPL